MLTFSHSCKREWNNPDDDIRPEDWAPQNLRINQITNTTVQLRWEDNSSGEDGFKIDRKVNDKNFEVEYASTPVNESTYTDNNVNTAINSYSYRVYAFSGILNSSYKQIATDIIFMCGNNLTADHSEGEVAPVTKTVTYGTVSIDLTGSTKCWITQNLGADHEATSADDDTEVSAGWYWQFNKKQGFKHDGITRTPNTAWISSINENSNWQAANDPCTQLLGSAWRLPTSSEWDNVNVNEGLDNYNDTYSSVLKLHAAGGLNYSEGLLENRGIFGYYWSSSQHDHFFGRYLNLSKDYCLTFYYHKAFGQSARCIRD